LQKIKITHLITELSIGGAQMALLRLLSGVNRECFAPSVVCLYNGDGAVAQQIRALGIPVTDVGMTSKARLDAFGRLFRLLRQQQPQILHTWMFHANIPGRLLGRLLGVPIIISAERTMGEGQIRRRLNRLTAHLADSVICVSERVAQFVADEIGIASQKLVVVPNGIDLSQFADLPTQEEARKAFNLPSQGTIVGAIGRPRPVKGYNFLIEAWAAPPAARGLGDYWARGRPFAPLGGQRGAYLLFVGDGPDQPALKAQAQQLGLGERVIFMGDQSKIPHLLPALDILALPSLQEGMPNVALEAMAASIPVVGTAVGGTPEVVIDGETGLLVPARDVTALANALATLMGDPARAKMMGKAGRERVEKRFSLKTTVQQTEALYDALLLERLKQAE
jgi:glycosyltransferase involved in cell wall biosynthesis